MKVRFLISYEFSSSCVHVACVMDVSRLEEICRPTNAWPHEHRYTTADNHSLDSSSSSTDTVINNVIKQEIYN